MLIFLYSIYFHFMKFIFTILVSVCQISIAVLFFYLVRRKRESIGYIVGKTWGKTVLFLSFIKIKKEIAPLGDLNKNYGLHRRGRRVVREWRGITCGDPLQGNPAPIK